MIEGLNKEILERLYSKEGKSVIAERFGCAFSTLYKKAKKEGCNS